MGFLCDVFDETNKLKSKNKHFKSNIHKEFDNCKHMELGIENPDINNVDEVFYAYIIQHEKEYDYYILNVFLKQF